MRYLSLAGLLFAFWLALSGHYTTVLIAVGAVCAVACLFAAVRMRAADVEGHPIELFRGAVTYFPWLVLEIAKSTWSVTKVLLPPPSRAPSRGRRYSTGCWPAIRSARWPC